ncbi:MAG TPA: alpha/beta fold hydrolase [Spirochaetia bacterium]|nr:alpha/beta fold hydrolase [Spirochaetia bacterium]
MAALAALTLLAGSCTTPPPAVETYPTEAARVMEIGGVDIHYFDFHPEADGVPIVWIHGYSGSAFETYFIHEALGSDRRLIAPDLPGSGFSGKPEREYTLDYFVSFVNEFTTSLGLTEFVLVGHSMGGLIASAVAAEIPAGLQKLVLIAPYGLTGQAGAIPEFLADTGVLVDYGFELHNETLIDLAIRVNVFHNSDQIPQDLIDYTKMSTFHTDNAIPALASVTRNVIAADHDPALLSRIALPTLIIWGADDRVLDFRYAATFNRLIEGSVLQAIPDCGHLPHVEHPRITAEIILRFLD